MDEICLFLFPHRYNWEDRLPEKIFRPRSSLDRRQSRIYRKIETWFSRSYQIDLRETKDPLPVSRRYAAQLKLKFS